MTQFFGKYRGKVKNNVDPMQQGRIHVSVPAVLGEGSLSWAMPCVPYAGSQVGFFAIPPVDANVWVEFGGDPDAPIWSGCFWARAKSLHAGSGGDESVQNRQRHHHLNDLRGGRDPRSRPPPG
jgi:uncharacterized protein involved in type VI secretion and phage assembly